MRRAPATGSTPAADRETAAVALVDSMLSRAAHRQLFTRDEARQMLIEVRESVDDGALSAAVASVVNDALLFYAEDHQVERRHVVDPLLDIRIALTHPQAVDEAADVLLAGR